MKKLELGKKYKVYDKEIGTFTGEYMGSQKGFGKHTFNRQFSKDRMDYETLAYNDNDLPKVELIKPKRYILLLQYNPTEDRYEHYAITSRAYINRDDDIYTDISPNLNEAITFEEGEDDKAYKLIVQSFNYNKDYKIVKVRIR